MIPRNYYFYRSWGSLLKTALFTFAITLLYAISLNAQTCTADAGTLSSIEICFQRNQVQLTAIPQGDTTVPSGYRILYVLTRGGELVIQAVSEEPTFTIDQTDNGLYTLHTLVYDTATLDLDSIQIGTTTGFDVIDLLIQGGGTICGSLDSVGAKVRFGACETDTTGVDSACLARTGTLTAGAGPFCIDSTGNSVTLSATVATAATVPAGFTTLYILTSGDSLTIEQESTSPSFSVDTAGAYRISAVVFDTADFDLLDSIIVFGQSSALALLPLSVQGGGDLCVAFDTTGALFNVTACSDTTGVVDSTCLARTGTLTAGAGPFCIDSTGNSVTLSATVATAATVPAGFTTLYILTSGDSLTIEQESTSPSFSVDTAGAYRISAVVFDTADFDLLDSIIVFGQSSALALLPLSVQGGGDLCVAFDTVGVSFNVTACSDTTGVVDSTCLARPGILTSTGGTFCIDSTGNSVTISATVGTPATVPAGFATLYILTSGDSLTIEQESTSPSFSVDSIGNYRISTVVFDTADFDLLDSIIVFGQSSALALLPLSIQGGGELCVAFDTVGVSFNVTSCSDTTGVDSLCLARPGSLRVTNEDFCLDDSTATLTAQVVTAPTVPTGFSVAYVLTAGDSLVIQAVSDSLSFTIDTVGRFTIHILVYDSTTLNLDSIILGQTTGGTIAGLFIAGGGEICGALDVPGAAFDVTSCADTCNVSAGSLRVANEGYCLRDSSATLTAAVATPATVSPGFSLIYVLTSGEDLVIEQASATPTFTVDTIGRFRIHALVYDSLTLDLGSINFGVTTGFEINNLFLQGGGTTCGALDVPGAIFNVAVCDTTGVDSTCLARTGTLAAGVGSFCIDSTGNSVTLSATVATAATVPAGFTTLYILTSGDSLIIEQESTTPSFSVDTIGTYSISAVVFDTADFDLLDSIIVFGQSSALALLPLSVQGGGDLCVAFDTTGALFNVTSCSDTTGVDSTCLARTGTLAAGVGSFCIDSTGNSVTLSATVATAATVPAGFTTLYILTSGDSLIIEQESTTPSFSVDSIGNYRISTVVFDTADFDLLDSIIVFGQSSALALLPLSVQGGGDLCVAFDTIGALFNVTACSDTTDTGGGGDSTCLARAGTTGIANNFFCLQNGTATLRGAPLRAATIPAGFVRIFVLTSGDTQIIQQESLTPTFTVNATGVYRIQQFVYDSTDFDFLDSIVVFGQSSVFDLLPLSVQGGGDICASFDTIGAVFNVIACNDSTGVDSTCLARTGTLTAGSGTVCIDSTGNSVTLNATVATAATVPAGFTTLYILTSGDSLIIEQESTTPSFSVDSAGTYRISAVIFDTADFDLLDSIVVFGQSSALDLLPLSIQGGGELCVAFDTVGALFNVTSCSDTTSTDSCAARAGTVSVVNNNFCFANGAATITAAVQTPPTIPAGFALLYILTSGDRLIIEQESTSPTFTVSATGVYRIHPFVYDTADFAFLDSIVVFGQTSALTLLPLSVQGGGDICAALDPVGAVFNVTACPAVDCSPTLSAGEFNRAVKGICLNANFQATLTPTVVSAPVVTPGFQIVYLLTSGSNQVIEEISDTASFTVDVTGRFTVLTLVYSSATLDLGNIDLGETTAGELNALLIQGDGTICGALNTFGGRFEVRDCGCGAIAPVLAYTGPNSSSVCTNSSGIGFAAATIVRRAIVPRGFELIYVLTIGNNRVIQAVNDIPVFGIRNTGIFRIHSLVYDPATLDLDDITFGVTTAAQLNALLRQGGGDICAGFDVTGLRFNVRDCDGLGGVDGLTLYPNPSNEYVNLLLPELDNKEEITIQVVDFGGNTLKQWKIENGTEIANLDLTSILPGTYYVRVMYGSEIVEQKPIVKIR